MPKVTENLLRKLIKSNDWILINSEEIGIDEAISWLVDNDYANISNDGFRMCWTGKIA